MIIAGALSTSNLDHVVNALAAVIEELKRVMQDQMTIPPRWHNGADMAEVSLCGGGNDERATRIA
jgi:hypothetical protein